MYSVIFYSRLGNTNKVAKVIAEELNTTVHPVRTVNSLPDDTNIILGSGLYFMRPARLVREFIKNNDFRGRKVALFGTSSTGLGIEVWWMERLLKRKGAIITGKYHSVGKFFCRIAGRRLTLIHKERPDKLDLQLAREFACSIRNEVEIKAEAVQDEKTEERILTRV